MFKMSAAHPTLPIPSYARVTNTANGAQVIVRINDRGPFHSTRIIDLSYTAALKLGYIKSGSAILEVERLLPADIAAMAKGAQASRTTPASQPDIIASVIDMASAAQENSGGGAIYLSFGAYPEAAVAATVRSRLLPKWASGKPALEIVEYGTTFNLYSGPYATREEAQAAAAQARQSGVLPPAIVLR
jgi:rare lipoprotein A